MRPYELIAFQWSVHIIAEPGGEPIHHKWIHFENSFPNFEFASSLRNLIDANGTPFMWASHENTVLRTILNQMEIFNYKDEKLKKWLTDMTSDNDLGREGRFVDMNKMT